MQIKTIPFIQKQKGQGLHSILQSSSDINIEIKIKDKTANLIKGLTYLNTSEFQIYSN